jgi:nucleoporin NUP82
MPKVVGYTPAWLAGPSPGHQIFSPKPTNSDHDALKLAGSYTKGSSAGPRRNIARRGTEVFVAVGREIRWTDLAGLKEVYEAESQDKSRKLEVTEDDKVKESVGKYRVSLI